MYSPRRTTTDDYDTLLRSPERSNMAASPLRAIASPFYKAVKTAQSNASRDFDKFYGSLQQKLTPRTSQARIQKQTPDTTERMRSMLQQRRAQAEYDSTRTSLTPLIERHTLQEDSRSNYSNYTNRNPFYQESVSEIADTPSLSDHNEDTPMTFTTLGKRSPTFTFQSPSNHHKRPYTSTSSTLQQKLAEEKKRMDKLQSNLQKIRRQSSLLAEDLSATHLSFEQADEDEDEEHDEEQDMFMAAAPSSKEDILRSLNVRSAEERRPSSNAFSVSGHYSPMDISSSRTYKHSITPQTNNIKPTASSSTVTQTTIIPPSSPPRRTLNHNSTNNNYSIPSTCDRTSPSSSPNRIVPPKRTIINDISSGHLRSAETLSTPGGSRVSNRFWKEIHGLSTRRESASPSRTTGGRIVKPTAPTAKRTSTLQIDSNNSWANDDGFWSSNSSPVASSLNNKLLQLAQEKDKEDKPTPIRQSFAKRLFDTNKESEADAEEHTLFRNPLFRRAAQAEQQQPHVMNAPSSTLPTQHANNNTLSAEIEVANKRDEIKKRNNIPTMNADVLAELKARHKEKLIDDTDSYKFA